MGNAMQPMLTAREVASILRTTPDKVRRLIQAGELRTHRSPRRVIPARPGRSPASLHILKLRSLLERPQRTQTRIEHEQQHQPAVLVHEELAVARLVPPTTHVTQPLEQRPQLAEILQALNIFFPNRTTLVAPHDPNMRYGNPQRKSK